MSKGTSTPAEPGQRVVVATDKFAGTLTAPQAASAIADGWSAVRPYDEVRTVPMADGGPGTVDVVAEVATGSVSTTITIDHLGRPVEARWLGLKDGVALVEACSACGLDLVSPHERSPLTMTTAGVGRLVAAVAQEGFRRIVVGLGGTGTVDAGVGAALELGADARDGEGSGLTIGGPVDFLKIESVTAVPVTSDIVIATDVSNPLLGADGAARTFGPQKGALPDDVEELETRLTHLAGVVERCLPGGPWREIPGAGAGGGLGFGLMAWGGATVRGGAEMVAQLVSLRQHIEWADLVITGEGSLDSQTRAGKAPAYVADVADAVGRPVAAVAGRVEPEAAGRFSDATELGQDGLADPTGSVIKAGARLARRWPGKARSGD